MPSFPDIQDLPEASGAIGHDPVYAPVQPPEDLILPGVLVDSGQKNGEFLRALCRLEHTAPVGEEKRGLETEPGFKHPRHPESSHSNMLNSLSTSRDTGGEHRVRKLSAVLRDVSDEVGRVGGTQSAVFLDVGR